MTDFVNIPDSTRQPQAIVLLDQPSGLPVSTSHPMAVEIVGASNVTLTGPVTVSNTVEITNDEGNAIPISAQSRTCLGTQMLTSLSTSTPASLTVPTGAVCADIQADGGTVRMRRDATAPTATTGWRIDDGLSVTVDSVLADVRLLAVSGTTTNVQICYFDRV